VVPCLQANLDFRGGDGYIGACSFPVTVGQSVFMMRWWVVRSEPETLEMNWRHYSLLFLISLAVYPGGFPFTCVSYMDFRLLLCPGEYKLANGHGFTEPFLWNYLDNPSGLRTPRILLDAPGILLAAAGAVLFGPHPGPPPGSDSWLWRLPSRR